MRNSLLQFRQEKRLSFHRMCCHDFQVPQHYKISVLVFYMENLVFLHQTQVPLTYLFVSDISRFQETMALFPPLQSNSVNIARAEQKNMIHAIMGVFQKRGILILFEGM